MTLVSIIVPCRNERRHIESFLANVSSQELPEGTSIEVLVADGGSDDGTREILAQISTNDSRILIVENPQKITSAGLNAAIRASRGDVVLRMDVHTKYATDYVAQCLIAQASSGADNVGGPWRAVGRGFIGEAVALAFGTKFASGGARGHNPKFEGPVDTVYLGCWRKEAFRRFGLFDENLARNQDDEHNLRIIRSAGHIWQTPKIRSWYTPRSSIPALFRQYAQYGYWKVAVIRKHHLPASFRHLVPACFVAALLSLAALSIFSQVARILLSLLVGSYLCLTVAASLWACRAPRTRRFLVVIPIIFATFHLGYGYGFLRGLAGVVGARREFQQASDEFTAITRGE